MPGLFSGKFRGMMFPATRLNRASGNFHGWKSFSDKKTLFGMVVFDTMISCFGTLLHITVKGDSEHKEHEVA